MTAAFRRFLFRPQLLRDRLNEAEEQLADIWSNCTRMTARYEGGCAGGSGGSAKDGILAAYADRHDTGELEASYREAVAEFEALMAQLPHRDAIILRCRYLRQLRWEAVVETLQTAGYRCGHLQTAYYWHRCALRRAEQKWEETQQ